VINVFKGKWELTPNNLNKSLSACTEKKLNEGVVQASDFVARAGNGDGRGLLR
jgi:hypothetical protein